MGILSLVSPLLRYWLVFISPLLLFSSFFFSFFSHLLPSLPNRFPIDFYQSIPLQPSLALFLPPHPPHFPFLFDHHLELPRSKISPPHFPLPLQPSLGPLPLPPLPPTSHFPFNLLSLSSAPPTPPTSPSCLTVI